MTGPASSCGAAGGLAASAADGDTKVAAADADAGQVLSEDRGLVHATRWMNLPATLTSTLGGVSHNVNFVSAWHLF